MIIPRRRLFSFLALMLVLTVTGRADETTKPDRVFLWEVKSGTTTVYLLGSVHAVNRDLYPLDDRITKAFAESDALVVEANIAGPEALAAGVTLMSKAMYPANDSLEQHVSKDVVDLAVKRMTKLGLPLDPSRFKPWFLSITITMAELAKAGILAQHGIDLHFLQKAAGKKDILELESIDFQANLLDSFNDTEQELFLKQTLHDADKIGPQTKDIIAAWKKGDTGTVEKILTEAVRDMPEIKPVQKRLIDDRNIAMAEKVEGYLATDKKYFVVVGAAHLVGETGLVNLLGKKFKVTQK